MCSSCCISPKTTRLFTNFIQNFRFHRQNFNQILGKMAQQSGSSTKIVDMNIDCIEHVLKLLDFPDLLKVAESNRHLHFVACSVLSRRYRRQNLRLTIKCSEKYRGYCDYRMGITEICVFKLPAALKILQYFGRVCSKIVIVYSKMDLTQKTAIEYHLGKYCADENYLITDIVLENCGKSALRFMGRPLRSIQNVVITDESRIDFQQLNRKFPNMSSLKLEWLQVDDGKCIERTFPALKQLEMEVGDRDKGFTEVNVQNAVRKNPQLIHLIVRLFQHPNLDERSLLNFLGSNFEAPGKILQVIPPNS